MYNYQFVFAHDKLIAWYEVFAKAWNQQNENNRTIVFVHGEKDFKYAQQYKEYIEVVDLLDGFKPAYNKTAGDLLLAKEINELENKLGYSFFWSDVRTDRWLRASEDKGFVIQYLNHTIKKVSEYYSQKQPALGFGESTMAIYRYIHRLFESDDKHYLAVIGNRYSKSFRVEGSWNWDWQKGMKFYNRYVEEGIPEELNAQVSEMYLNITEKFSKPIAFENFTKKNKAGYKNPTSFSFKQIIEKFKLFFSLPNEKEFKRNPRYAIVESSLLQKVKRIIGHNTNHRQYEKLTQKELPKDLKICSYFPHYQPEYTVDSLGKFYMNQNYLIGNIAAALPSDYYLVVKDHPTMIGLRKPEFYQDILSNTNVILLHHTFDSIHLIKRSDIIFTIVGSAAIEANIIGKPSILFGRYAFDTTNLISFCPDFWQLPEMINKKLNQSHSQEDIKRHAYALLAAKISGSHVGRIPFTEDEMEDYGHLEDKMIKGYVDELKELGVLNIKSSVNS